MHDASRTRQTDFRSDSIGKWNPCVAAKAHKRRFIAAYQKHSTEFDPLEMEKEDYPGVDCVGVLNRSTPRTTYLKTNNTTAIRI